MAELTLDSLAIKIQVWAEGAQEQIDDLNVKLDGLKGKHQEAGKAGQESGAAQAAAYGAVAVAAAKAFGTIIDWVGKGVEAHNRYTASIKGLQSVAAHQGIGDGELQKALEKLEDQFFDTTAASTALKNLLSRGYTMDQAIKTITSLKDAAAFGRQANLQLKDAVVTATEGIKNENSVLVDNAGVTKNVAKMWEEYAKARGIATTELTQAQKIEAEYLGIQQETIAQTGDLAKLQGELAGTQAKTAMTAEQLAIAFGEAMSPVVQLLSEALNWFLGLLKGIVEASPQTVAALTAVVVVLTGMLVVTKAAAGFNVLSTALKGAGTSAAFFGISMKAAFPILGLVALAVGAITAAVVKQKQAQKEAAEELNRLETESQNIGKNIESLDTLGRRYEELSQKENKSVSDKKEMKDILGQLVEQYGFNVDGLGNLEGSYGEVTKAIREKIKAMREEQAETQKGIYDEKQNALAKEEDSYLEALGYVEAYNRAVEESKRLEAERSELFTAGKVDEASALETQISFWESEKERLSALQDVSMSKIKDHTLKENELLIEGLKSQALTAATEGHEGAAAFIDSYRAVLESAVQENGDSMSLVDMSSLFFGNAENTLNLDVLENFKSQVLNGILPNDEERTTFESAWDAVVTSLYDVMGKGTGDQILQNFFSELEEIPKTGKEAADALINYVHQMEEEMKNAKLADEAKKLGDSMVKIGEKAATIKAAAPRVLELKKAMDDYAKSAKTAQDKSNFHEVVKSLGISMDDIANNWKQVQEKANGIIDNFSGDLLGLEGDVANIIYTIGVLEQKVKIEGKAYMDVSQALAAIGIAEGEIDALIAKMKAAGIDVKSTEKKKGGGGGSRKNKAEEAARAAEQAAREAEQARKDALQADYDYVQYLSDLNRIELEGKIRMYEDIGRRHAMNLEERRRHEVSLYQLNEELRQNRIAADYDEIAHKKAMGEMNVAQEIAALEEIKRAHMLNAKELRTLEEELYAAYEALRQERLQGDLALYNHRKNMGELTTKDEITSLEAILNAHQLTQSERWSLEEQLYALRKQLADEAAALEEDRLQKEVGQVNTLATGIITALKAKYKEMEEGELALLEASKKGWKDWAVESKKAIQEQIDAIDALSQAEDREKKDEEELRKIASLEQQIAFEQNDFNRLKLEDQLRMVIADREARLKKQARDDEKAALKEEMAAIDEKAKAEQEALDIQKEALKEAYKDRLTNTALQAEAEKLLMEKSQEEILALIGEYAPDYNATGKSLGERFVEGFKGAVNDIEGWFDAFNKQIEAIQQNARDMALNAGNAFYKDYQDRQEQAGARVVYLQPTYEFNQPIESPSDVSRRVARTNEELANQLNAIQ